MAASAASEFVCPGESYAISRPVHFARMAAGYRACRDCPLQEGFRQPEAAPRHGLRRLVTTDGIRGVYRNDVDEAVAERIAAALANRLWDEAGESRPPASGFSVVVGADGRPWSLALAVAAGKVLRRYGCETIDVGLATAPEFRFAVAHLDATAGVLATGAGGGPAVAGFDFAVAAGRPLSEGGSLDGLLEIADREPSRPTRRGGGGRPFDVRPAYEAGLRRHLRAGAPVTSVVGTSSDLVADHVARLFRDATSRPVVVRLPRRPLDAAGSDPAALTRLAASVREHDAGFGLWIDESGSACRALDETGRMLSMASLAALLLSDLSAERPGALAADWTTAEQLAATSLRRAEIVRGNGSAEGMFLTLADHAAVAGADAAGRIWLSGPAPSCDALPVLARLLRIVAESAEPLSRLSRGAAAAA